MSDIEGFILAGGASSRMGEDKSRLRIGGQTFVGRIAEALNAVTGRVRLVSSRSDACEHGLTVIRDAHEGLGALGGIHAALAACESRWAFVVSCDLPFVTGELLERLTSLRLRGEPEAVAPVQPDGLRQPLCALYAAKPCLPLAEELIRAGELRPRSLLSKARTLWVGFDELSDLEGSALFFRNVNTRDDYRRALDDWRGGEGGR